LAISEVRGIVGRACARQDVLDACATRDLGAIIALLKPHGITQVMIAECPGDGESKDETDGRKGGSNALGSLRCPADSGRDASRGRRPGSAAGLPSSSKAETHRDSSS
jgi:hypothetical protein